MLAILLSGHTSAAAGVSLQVYGNSTALGH
jgi:hypothetical protein